MPARPANKLQSALLSVIGLSVLGLSVYWLGTTTRLAMVPSESMEPTLQHGDLLLLRIDAYRHHEPQRGDLLIFRSAEGVKDYYVKRVIGLPGETLFIFRGRVWINHQLLDEPYVQGRGVMEFPLRGVVPPRTLLVLGDNRDHSSDSRDFGPVPRELVVGQVTAIIWPLKNRGRLPAPDYGTFPLTAPPPAEKSPAEPPPKATGPEAN